jgi:hypothetical protein
MYICKCNRVFDFILYGINQTPFIVREWLLFNAKWWDDDNDLNVGDQNAWLDFYSVSSQKQQCACRCVVRLEHNILTPKQPVFVLTP